MNCGIPYLPKYGMKIFFLTYHQDSGAFVIITHEISKCSVWVCSATSVISLGGWGGHFLFE